jgi:GT2 family glycosyltransferase
MKQTSILVVIVNFRTPEMVLRCLESLSLEKQVFPLLRVAVIDNNSADGSVERMRSGVKNQGWEEWAQIIASDQNPGFGAGNNRILRKDLASDQPADFYFILNPDTVVFPGIFQAFLEFFLTKPEASILGPGTKNGDGILDYSAFRFPGIINSLSEGLRFGLFDRLFSRWVIAPKPRAIAYRSDWVSGGGIFLKRKVFQVIGLFDEQFFLYFEETDLCHRAAQKGIQTWYVPAAGIMHWAGSSTGITDGTRKRMPGWWFASRRHYLRKFHGLGYVILCNLAFIFGRSIWQLRAWTTRIESNDPHRFLWDFLRYNLLGQRWDHKK